jgi:hypothetical protein
MAARVRLVGEKWYVFVTFQGKRKAKMVGSKAEALELAARLNKALELARLHPNGLDALLAEYSHQDMPPGEPGIPVLPTALAKSGKKSMEYAITQLPPCIYFLCLDGEVVYVGRTINLAKRISTHGEDKGKLFDRVFYLPTAENDLEWVEVKFISLLKPQYNRVGIRSRPPDDFLTGNTNVAEHPTTRNTDYEFIEGE